MAEPTKPVAPVTKTRIATSPLIRFTAASAGPVTIKIGNGSDALYAVKSVLSSQSSGWPMDPLSDVLSLLKPRSYVSGGLDVGGIWSIQFRRHEGIKCYAVVSGQCWLSVEDVPDAVRLKTGDCFLLPSGRPFRLASDLKLTPLDYTAVFATRSGGVGSLNGGG